MSQDDNPYVLISKIHALVYWLALDMARGQSQVKTNKTLCSIKALIEQLELRFKREDKSKQMLNQSNKLG